MKVIDLLNKIANGEEVPEIIYYSNLIFKWTGLNYYCEKVDEFLDNHICIEDLEQKVEIIEEQKEHKIPEKLKCTAWGDKDENSNYIMSAFPTNEELMNKINEILDYLEEIK